MSLRYRLGVAGAVALALMASVAEAADNNAEKQSIDEVRNTVINLLQAMVEKGLLTREQAEALVKQAQQKASADAAAAAAKDAAVAKQEENAVRVPYVPQIVKDEISKQVAQKVEPAVVADVVKEAKEQKWGVPAALPEWLSRVKVFGDVTVREQSDFFPRDNSQFQIFDYEAINQAGSIGKTTYPFLNTLQDRNRMRLRARLGAEGDLSSSLTAYIRLASGSLIDPGSESQTFGTYAQRYTVGIDQAYIVWNPSPQGRGGFAITTAQVGRIPNPWFSPTELIYARDLSFEGAADTLRFGWGPGGVDRSQVYLTLGGFPVLEVPLLNQENKWLVGGQIGTNLRWGSDSANHLLFGAAYYDFVHVTGQRNAPQSTLLNFTAPAFLRAGNSVFDIANDPTQSVNLFALAAHFRLVDLAATYQRDLGPFAYSISGEGVRNVGYNQSDVEALTGQTMPSKENTGYVAETSFGHPIVDSFGKWRAAVGYRYVKRDAVIDAWTDADFHGGGTNVRGYYLWGSLGLARNTWVRVRYMSGNEIDGPRFGQDILQVDLNARF